MAMDAPVAVRMIQPWFHRAGLGLFVHWGPCSVAEVEISWTLFRNWGDANPYWPPEKYNALADQFDPQHYDPDKWLAAAARAGFKYVVFVARHCDGYAMWPSQYGAFGTRQKMKGRDLVRPYVEACRKNGLKVGLYYSPTDWNFCPEGWPYRTWPRRDPKLLYTDPEKWGGVPHYIDMKQEEFDKYYPVFFDYLKGQVTELLTNYGKVDLLWWDGLDWPPGFDVRGAELENYVRKLQPEIVLNDRFNQGKTRKTLGDYNTDFEGRNPEKRPAGAWEQCEPMCGGWSYRGAKARCKTTPDLIDRLARTRSWGGNYLPNFGPRADGTMQAEFYTVCDELAAWMKHSAESVYDVEAGPYPQQCTCPVTVKGRTWYVHFVDYHRSVAAIKGKGAPKSAILLRTGKPVVWRKEGDEIWVCPERADFTPVDDVVAVTWES